MIPGLLVGTDILKVPCAQATDTPALRAGNLKDVLRVASWTRQARDWPAP
jgi:hypothetical protein